MKRFCFMLLAASVMLLSSGSALAEEAPGKGDARKEIEDLKARLDALEKKTKEAEVIDELGHKLHPIHSIYGLKISGGLTITAQGVTHIKGSSTHKGAAALSADLVLESPVGKNGRAVGVLDIQRGRGLQNLPAFFTSPNGNTTGPNNDIESFDNDQVHLAQFYYEHNFSEKFFISIGQLDPTAYFDSNALANNERSQYLANLFVNNPAIEFGGSDNFYGPGVRVTYFPLEDLDISLGAFEGREGDFSNAFDNPFVMAELNYKHKHASGKEGNFRAYYWNRQGRASAANTANPNDPALRKAGNQGAGVSIDHQVTDNTGVWLRAGVQREKVAQFNRHVSGGLSLSGAFGRQNDTAGFGYGLTLMGKDYKDFKKRSGAFNSGPEHYLELYYNLAVGDATQFTGFHITPDVQYVINAGGDKDSAKLFIYGVRLQAFF